MTVSELVSLMKQWHMLYGTGQYLNKQMCSNIEDMIEGETLLIGVDTHGDVRLYLDPDVHGNAIINEHGDLIYVKEGEGDDKYDIQN